MDLQEKTPAALGTRSGAELSLLGGVDSLDRTTTSSKSQDFFSVADLTKSALVADLLAESLEVAIGAGLGVLRALREADDETAFVEFRRFDLASRTAKACAFELRALREGGAA